MSFSIVLLPFVGGVYTPEGEVDDTFQMQVISGKLKGCAWRWAVILYSVFIFIFLEATFTLNKHAVLLPYKH